jgi:sulfate permease, SulP family
VSWRETLDLVPVAISCFVMIIAQSAATSRVYALLHKERVDENADILGLAAANVGAAVTGAFVVNGSPTQTAMAHGAGACSQVAQLTFALIVVVVLLFLTGPLQYLPHCVLASVVFTIAVGMVDVKGLKAIMQESRGEFLLALFTAAAVPGIGVEQGILLAIALSLVRHVRHSYRPNTMVLAPNAQGRWTPTAAKPGIETEPGLIVYRFGADLFYANADRFADEALALIHGAPEPVRRFVVDASAMTDIDYSAARTLRDFIGELTTRKIGIAFGRVSPSLHADMRRHGVAVTLGEGHIFSTRHEALEAARGDDAMVSLLGTRGTSS